MDSEIETLKLALLEVMKKHKSEHDAIKELAFYEYNFQDLKGFEYKGMMAELISSYYLVPEFSAEQRLSFANGMSAFSILDIKLQQNLEYQSLDDKEKLSYLMTKTSILDMKSEERELFNLGMAISINLQNMSSKQKYKGKEQ